MMLLKNLFNFLKLFKAVLCFTGSRRCGNCVEEHRQRGQQVAQHPGRDQETCAASWIIHALIYLKGTAAGTAFSVPVIHTGLLCAES